MKRTPITSHPDLQTLRAFYFGELTDAEIEVVTEHLSTCSDCLSTLDTLTSIGSPGEASSVAVVGARHCEEPEFEEFQARAKAFVAEICSDAAVTEADELARPAFRLVGFDQYQDFQEVGSGGFGKVYRAHNREDDCVVAIKVPKRRCSSGFSGDDFFREARILAGLTHPAIVSVLDWGTADDGTHFVVMDFIKGFSLKKVNAERRPTFEEAALLVSQIADALHHAHLHGLTHRDVKPANIVMGEDGSPCLVDFGLSVHDEERWQHQGELAGTRAYMAPEQVQGEAHRLDGRTDVWSLSVVLYETLTGRRPFRGATPQVMDEILHRSPTPLRQINDSIPAELERISLRGLSKRRPDRYATARDMAVDLRHWLANSTERTVLSLSTRNGAPLHKGLRAFDSSDSESFLELIPGARDRDGIPESIRFWKSRVEGRDDDTFRVGVLLGPCGSGKSSLILAGLLPRLDADVRPVHVDAQPRDLSEVLLARLRRQFSLLDSCRTLSQALQAVRRGQVLPAGHKLLLVIDQFEQWLSRRTDEQTDKLVAALRQCDGARLQAMLLVRHDFTLETARFMEALEEPLLQRSNFAVTDSFSTRHAKHVLAVFGRAHGALGEDLTQEQSQFLDQIINSIGGESHVIPVQLALFAEVLKDKAWTQETSRKLGGIQGVGLAFLEDRLTGPNAHPLVRAHPQLVRQVIAAMVPAEGMLKGAPVARRQLLDGADDHQTVDGILSLLDTEVRLLTLARPTSEASLGEPHYQLAHDYLVPSLREWLATEERLTAQGRARLRLKQLAVDWNANPQPRRLPTLPELLTICCLTHSATWTDPQRRMMQTAIRRVGISMGVWATLACAALALAFGVWRQRELAAHVERLYAADILQVPGLIENLQTYGDRAKHYVAREFQRNHPSFGADLTQAKQRRLRSAFLLGHDDSDYFDFVVRSLPSLDEDEIFAAVRVLGKSEDLQPDETRKLIACLHGSRFNDWAALFSRDPVTELSQRLTELSEPAVEQATSFDVQELPKGVTRKLRQHGGVSTSRAAFVQSLPLSEFDVLAEQMSDFGYRPNSFRPFIQNDQKLVAATWSQDGQDWRIERELAPQQLLDADQRLPRFTIVDVAVVEPPTNQPAKETRFAGLWRGRSGSAKNQLYIDESPTLYSERDDRRRAMGFLPERLAIQMLDAESPRYTSIWRKSHETAPDAFPRIRSRWDYGDLFPGHLQTDCRLILLDPQQRDCFAAVKSWRAYRERVEDRASSASRAGLAKYAMICRRYEEAERLLCRLVAEHPRDSKLCELRSTCLFRLEDVEAFRGEVARFEKIAGQRRPAVLQLMRLRLALLERDATAARQCVAEIENGLSQEPQNSERLSSAASAHALICSTATAFVEEEVARSRSRCVRLLRDLVDQGDLTRREDLLDDEDLDGVRHDVRFATLAFDAGVTQRHIGVWRVSSDFQSKELTRLEPAIHTEMAIQLLDEGYLPVVISTKYSAPSTAFLTSSVWQHAVQPTRDVINHDELRARLAITLAHLGAPSALFRSFRDGYDRNLRAETIEWTSRLQMDPQLLIDRLGSPFTAREHRAILLTLGGYAADALSQQQSAELQQRIEVILENHPSAAMRSAAIWCDRQLNLPATATNTKAAGTDWEVNSVGQTMVMISPPAQVKLGSPTHEAERDRAEYQFWVNIPRVYSIAAEETTVRQFGEFLADEKARDLYRGQGGFTYSKKYAYDEQCPQIGVDWFDAARFCQWLSELEDLPEEQWCYPGIWQADEGTFRLPENVLERTGYRLPTEAEWELACRAGSEASWSHGLSAATLRGYAWYDVNSGNRTHPVCSLRPNGYGLFDMHGNVNEWCLDTYRGYRVPINAVERSDAELKYFTVSETSKKVVRGGHFGSPVHDLRSANRQTAHVTNNRFSMGFRVARTVAPEQDD